MRLEPLIALLACLALSAGCSSPDLLTRTTDPWSLPAAAQRGGIEFISVCDLEATPPIMQVIGARVTKGADVRLKQVSFRYLASREDGQRVQVRLGPTGDAWDGTYLLFGSSPVHATERPLWVRAEAQLSNGEEVVEEWLLR